MKVLGTYNEASSSSSKSAVGSEQTKLKNDKIGSRLSKKKTTKAFGEKESKSSSYPSWHNIVAGAAAGAGARFFTAPLDLIKIRRQLVQSSNNSSKATSSLFSQLGLFQSFRDIVKNEGGLPSLFRGNLAATYLWIGYAAVQFSLYARTSDFLVNNQFQIPPFVSSSIPAPLIHPMEQVACSLQRIGTNPTAVAFCSGALAGTAATIATYPFDICRTAFAARGLTTLEPGTIQSFFTEATKNSVNKNPLRNLFAGCGPAVLGIIPYMGINFALYDYLVRTSEKTKVGDAGIAGAIAGGTSKLIVYPLDTVKKRLQAQAFNTFWGTRSGADISGLHNTEYKDMIDCAMKIMKEEGISSFYRGLVPTVLKTMGATGLTFAIFTFTKNTLETTHDYWFEASTSNESAKNRSRNP